MGQSTKGLAGLELDEALGALLVEDAIAANTATDRILELDLVIGATLCNGNVSRVSRTKEGEREGVADESKDTRNSKDPGLISGEGRNSLRTDHDVVAW